MLGEAMGYVYIPFDNDVIRASNDLVGLVHRLSD